MAGNMPVKFDGPLTPDMKEEMTAVAHCDRLDPLMRQMSLMMLAGKDFPDYDKAFELIEMLDEAGIPYDKFAEPSKFGIRIAYPSDKDNRCDAVIHMGSYGRENGTLEIMGLLTEEEMEYNSVKGHMEPQEVFDRIKADYEKDKDIGRSADDNRNGAKAYSGMMATVDDTPDESDDKEYGDD